MTTPPASALYLGEVMHQRTRPRVHRLRYALFSLLLDLDELDALDRRLRLFSVDRFNLFSFFAKDRGDRSGSDLRAQVETSMRAAGLTPDGGAIRLLTMPRLLGWAFNPLSIFFCHDRAGSLVAVLWEVDNTFGERHGYLIPVDEVIGGVVHQHCDKAFYVSPFMDMDLTYAFRLTGPAETLTVVIDVRDRDGTVLTARHLARRVELTDRALAKVLVTFPFQTLAVVGGIYWEALKIWIKGLRLRTRPPAPLDAVSITPLSPDLRKARRS